MAEGPSDCRHDRWAREWLQWTEIEGEQDLIHCGERKQSMDHQIAVAAGGQAKEQRCHRGPLWTPMWQDLYDFDTESFELIAQMRDTYYLVAIIDNNFLSEDDGSLFQEIFKVAGATTIGSE